jgi:hypothetical protein
MPRLIKDFQATEPDAVGVYAIDFGQNIPGGAALQSAAWSLGVHYVLPGAMPDSAPMDRLIGSPTVAGSQTQQSIGNLLAGNDYLVTCTGTMSDGEVVVLWTVLPCRRPQ